MIARVSVVIPFRNALEWLSRTLAALAVQDGVPFELVAVDDGSDDDSAELIVRVWPSLRPDVPLKMVEAGGRGVSAARNAGVGAATAPLIAFLDADDLAYPGRLAQQAAQLWSCPGLAQSLCGWRRIDEKDRLLSEVRPWNEGAGFEPVPAFLHKAVLPSAWMLRRDWFDRLGGFDVSLNHAEDVDLLLRLSLAGGQGTWLRRCLCGYRVHGLSASRSVVGQVNSLVEVVNRHLELLPSEHPIQSSAIRIRHGTMVWCGWYAWNQGELPLAQQLFLDSWRLSPYGPARSWWSLVQMVVDQNARSGFPVDVSELLSSSFWLQLCSLIRGRPCGEDPAGEPPSSATDVERHHHGWRLLVSGAVADGLALWRQQLLVDLKERREPFWAPWEPDLLWAWWQEQPPEQGDLARHRRRALRWFQELLAWDGHSPDAISSLSTGLQKILLGLVKLNWNRGRRQVEERLEVLFALQPHPLVCELLARLLERDAAAAAFALRSFAPLEDAEQAEGFIHWQPPIERCLGPDCSLCSSIAPASADVVQPFRLHRLPWGRIWIKPPSSDPWRNTLAVGVVDHAGVPLEPLCRRYPLGGSGCLYPYALPPPQPAGPPLKVDGPVLAVAELSAEVFYHQLLELIPRLGLSLERISPEERGRLHLWHNAGQPALLKSLGIDRFIPEEHWIAACDHPHLQAMELIVPDWLSPFGEPSARSINWLREQLLPLDSQDVHGDRWIWLGRAPSLRRPVWGEANLLSALASAGVPLEHVNLHTMELVDQAATLAASRVVVAPHGSAMANLVFCGAGTIVVELYQRRYQPHYFDSISTSRRLRHIRVEQPQVPPTMYGELFFDAPISEPIVLDPSSVIKALHQFI